MYKAYNKVRMHDTDMAGILYFARQFRFAHDALEDFVESLGYDFNKVFHDEKFVFVIVHCEADYYASLKVGDKLEVQVTIQHVGNSSFSVEYRIFRNEILVGSAKTVHVTLDSETRVKTPIPPHFRKLLIQHQTET